MICYSAVYDMETDKEIKVLVATGLYPPEIGGPATHTVLMEKELPKFGHIVSVLPFHKSRRFPKILRHVHFFFSAIKHGRSCDVFFAQDVASVGLPALLAAKVLRKHFIVRVPGDYAWEQSTQRFGVKDTIDDFQIKKYSFRVEALRSIQKFVTRNANKVVTPSEYFNTLVKGWGVASGNIITIQNGVNLDIEPIAPQKPEGLFMVTAGRLVPWKGIATLVQTLEYLPDWSLVVLGSGPEEKSLKDLVKKLSLSDRVIFPGMVSREEVFGWCQSADAFVLNTAFESFSYQLVEAMSSGTPVITTNVGSNPELITSGVEGVLVEPDDIESMVKEIQGVVQNKDAWEKRVVLAQAKASTLDISRTMDKLSTLFQTV